MVIRVQTRDNEPVEKALRRLRKLCNNEGVTRTSKSKSYFEKPSERRRREQRERKKAIRLSMRAKRQDVAKLLQRRRKARKNARAAQRAEANSAANAGTENAAPTTAPATPAASTTTPAPETATS
ncbi:MAG: hypothetical protein DHS20C15_02520 [Planctomycetota bacterium]|nr:MAG: hypothetical protein DHS20C15_02520 [Planctomycetota bacterium]